MEVLIPFALKPGGIYIVEDLVTSFEKWMGSRQAYPPTIEYVQSIISNITLTEYRRNFDENMEALVRVPSNTSLSVHIIRLECGPGICALEKKSLDAIRRLANK